MNTRTDNRALIRLTHNCITSDSHKHAKQARPYGLQLSAWLFFLILTLFLCSPFPAWAENEPVTARFKSSKGQKLTVELKVARPVPGSVIFTLNLPEKVKLLEADPPAGKYDTAKGQVKWLLRGLSPGTHGITLHFSTGVSADSLNAEVRYLNSATGKLCILPVKK